MIGNTRRKHRDKFSRKPNFYLDSINLKNILLELQCEKSEIIFNKIGNLLVRILKKSRLVVEGLIRVISF